MLHNIILRLHLTNRSTAVLADSPQIVWKLPGLNLKKWFVMASRDSQRVHGHLHSILCLKKTIVGASVVIIEHSARELFLTCTPSAISSIFHTLFMAVPSSVPLTVQKRLPRYQLLLTIFRRPPLQPHSSYSSSFLWLLDFETQPKPGNVS